MVKTLKKLSLIAAFVLLMPCANAWFTWSNDWGQVYIATVNGIDTSPVGYDDAPATHDVSAALPLTITFEVADSDLYEVAVNVVEVQYKVVGETGWNTLDLTYEDESRNYDFSDYQHAFGGEMITDDMPSVDPGDTVLVRLYIAHQVSGVIENQNADKSNDTDQTGTNGWQDPWVVGIILESGHRPSWN